MSLTGLLFWASRPTLPLIAHYPVRRGEWADDGPADSPTLRVLSYNMHFGVGPSEPTPLPNRPSLLANLDAMARCFADSGADVVLLQEIDFGAKRTHYVDMVSHLAERAGLPYMARALCWEKNYLPFPYWPPQHHWGRIRSGLAVLSRYPLALNRMHLLPKPGENRRLYNLFYIDRGVQIVDVTIGPHSVRLFNLHLEAYKVTGRMRQARLLVSLVRAMQRPLMIVAGDFNALPPASPHTCFADEPDNDFSGDQTMSIILSQLGQLREIQIDRQTVPTAPLLTFPAPCPARRLDYMLHSGSLDLRDGGVLHRAGSLSDHLPLLAEFSLPAAMQPA